MLKFSVIVPIYKVEKYIRECIESVMNQTYSNWELILVDDGSPDKCPEICCEYAVKDNRVIVCHKENAGLPAARNSGIKLVTGDYFMHLDGDDFWDTDYLRNVELMIREDPQKDIYLGNSRVDYINGAEKKVVLYEIDKAKGKTYSDVIQLFFSQNNCIPTAAWHNVYSTKYQKLKNLYFDEKLTWSEDADNFYQWFFSTKKIGFFEYTFYYYRKDNDTAMTKNPSMQHFTSNISVTKRWFEYVDNSDLTEQDKKVIMRRFANGYMYNLKMISCLEKKEYEIVTGMMMREKKMMKYIGGFPCKYIYILTKIIGCRNTSNLLNLIKGER